MAENEKKTPEAAETSVAEAKEVKADVKAAKKKDKGPNVFSRAIAWLRTTKAELKKVVWTPKKTVIRNTALTLVVMAVTGLGIGLLDYVFSVAIVALGRLL